MTRDALNTYEQAPAARNGDGWTGLIAPVIAAAIVLALGLLLVTLTSTDTTENNSTIPTVQTISR
jgi:hypothetical protein